MMMHSENLLCCMEIYDSYFCFLEDIRTALLLFFLFFACGCLRFALRWFIAWKWHHRYILRIFNLQHIFDNVRTSNSSTMLIGAMNF